MLVAVCWLGLELSNINHYLEYFGTETVLNFAWVFIEGILSRRAAPVELCTSKVYGMSISWRRTHFRDMMSSLMLGQSDENKNVSGSCYWGSGPGCIRLLDSLVVAKRHWSQWEVTTSKLFLQPRFECFLKGVEQCLTRVSPQESYPRSVLQDSLTKKHIYCPNAMSKVSPQESLKIEKLWLQEFFFEGWFPKQNKQNQTQQVVPGCLGWLPRSCEAESKRRRPSPHGLHHSDHIRAECHGGLVICRDKWNDFETFMFLRQSCDSF